jgi:DNA-binding response OmpR family regulator
VLVVDDDAALRAVLAAALGEAGDAVAAAPDGAAALALLARRGPPGHPDLILLDLELPGLDGRGFAARSRARWGPRAPLVVVSAAPTAAAQAARLGAAAWVTKPFDLDELLAHVARLARPRPAA